MNRQSLMCFSTLAETLNFSKAAECLFISQPALSRHIAKLEKELGCVLFERNTHKVELTRSGIICLEYVNSTLREYGKLIEVAKGVSGVISGTLLVGYSGRSNIELVSQGLRDLHELYPHVKARIFCNHIEGLKRGLRSGEYDIIILFEPCIENENDMEWITLKKSQFDAVLPEEHPLANCMDIPLNALKNERFVSSIRETAPQIYDTRIKLCAEAGFVPNIVEHVKNAQAAAISVGALGLVTLLPKASIDPCTPGISVVPIQGLEGSFNIILAWRKGETNPCIQLFCRILKG